MGEKNAPEKWWISWGKMGKYGDFDIFLTWFFQDSMDWLKGKVTGNLGHSMGFDGKDPMGFLEGNPMVSSRFSRKTIYKMRFRGMLLWDMHRNINWLVVGPPL